MSVEILIGDCRKLLQSLKSNSVHCVVTSPPYWGLRDYGVADQIGLESTFAIFLAEMVSVFREVRRVLRDDGTLWLNLGDAYCHDRLSSPMQGDYSGDDNLYQRRADYIDGKMPKREGNGFKVKDLMGMPWRVAFALQDDGWYFRQDIIWSKINPMPESVTDRCTKAHEYLFFGKFLPKLFLKPILLLFLKN
jgi:DNA modification methylase